MTVGELARYFNSEKKLGVQLHVVKMKGWRRSYYFWNTGQYWIDTSPNMRNMLEAILYPGVCLLEGTNVSVGRGTDRPFEVVGAPWIDSRRFAAALRALQPPGVAFVPVSFTPSASHNRGIVCGGVHILITDCEKVNSVLVGLTLISVLQKLYPKEFEIGSVIDLLGNAEAMKKIRSGISPVQTLRANDPEIRNFLTKRRKAMIYDQAMDARKRGNDGAGRSKEKEKR
jgi:uncharacterized protein YbbC (DUF1343 family)